MEIDITKFLVGGELADFSASAAELGPNAGQITWANALREGAESPLLTSPDEIQAFRDYMHGFGAWTDEQIDGWDSRECNALFTQFVAGDLREAGFDDCDLDQFDWQNYQAQCEAGNLAGRFYRGDDGRVYFSLSD